MEKVRVTLLQQEIRRLQEERADREKALPAHSIRPHQLLVIEELEEEIRLKEEELKVLLAHRRDADNAEEFFP